ncbi:MAG: ACP S-malonyltransferase [Candidatus Latescibacterota bacterium]|nr:MAG: ACP S-malonyltransferase [Candidatus Latescibacterota bacterium]
MDCAMLFPGQASQYVGMGRDYYDACEVARETYKAANEALGFDIAALSFEGDLDELTKTHNAQPAILVHSMVVYRALVKQGLTPRAVAGHSLGEFSALVAAGYFELIDALLIVRKRGELMYEAGLERPGNMAAVIGMDEENVQGCVADAADSGVVVVANFNSPGQFAISGEIKAVDRAVEIAKERGAKRAMRLQVSGAFHSPLMEETSDALIGYINRFKSPGRLDCAWIANVTGDAVEDPGRVVDLLARQLSSPVLWTRSMQTLSDMYQGPIFEVGPGKVLTGLMKRIVRESPVQPLTEAANLEKAVQRKE